MTDPKKREQIARKRTPSPLSSDSYDEMDDDYILINDNTNEVRWNGDQTKYVRRTPTPYQAAVMTAKEAWEGFSVETVQHAVGTAASDLTIKASELTTVATANLSIASVQHSVGSAASKLASVASKVVYQAASKVPDLISPKQTASFSEDGITVTNRDMGPGMNVMVVQHAQITDDIWEPPTNSSTMESIKRKSEDVELEKSLDEIIETRDTGTGSDCKRATYQGRSGKTSHGKITEMPGPLRDDKLLHKRRALHGNPRDKHFFDDGFEPEPVYGNTNLDSNRKTNPERSASNHRTKDTKNLTARYTNTIQDPMGGKHIGQPRTQRHLPKGSGPSFTQDRDEYDALGVSSVWKSPHKDLLSADRTKAMLQCWQDKEDRSARDEENRKTPAERGARPSRIPVRAGKAPRTVDNVDHKDRKN